MVRFHCPEFVDLIETNEIFVARTRGVGRMSPELAIDMSLTGPPLRATGVDFDVRRDYPYSWYPNVEFNVVTDAAGSTAALARTKPMFLNSMLIPNPHMFVPTFASCQSAVQHTARVLKHDRRWSSASSTLAHCLDGWANLYARR
jgi:hypothetical protein